ncbi:hypothetical protein L0F63_000479, partial [Massospora cicadina]
MEAITSKPTRKPAGGSAMGTYLRELRTREGRSRYPLSVVARRHPCDPPDRIRVHFDRSIIHSSGLSTELLPLSNHLTSHLYKSLIGSNQPRCSESCWRCKLCGDEKIEVGLAGLVSAPK